MEFSNLQQPFEQGASQALVERVASDTAINAAYDWLCMQRQHDRYNNDVLMAVLRVVLLPDKTFIGRIARGFDFLGYWFSHAGLSIAAKTVERIVDKVSRLFEQGADDVRIEAYLIRWWQWVRSGVGNRGDLGWSVGFRASSASSATGIIR